MRIRQRSFWGVLALLLCTTTTQIYTTDIDLDSVLTDKPYTATSSSDLDLTFPLYNTTKGNFTTKNGESINNNQSPNYTYMSDHQRQTYILSTNNNSHSTQPVQLPFFTLNNESTYTHGHGQSLENHTLTKAENGNINISSNDYLEIEQRLSPDHVMFHQDIFNDQDENSNNVLETREIEEAADYGLRMMHDLIRVKEPKLYKEGLWLQPDSAAGKVAAFSAPLPQVQRLARYGYAAVQASTKLLQQWLGGIHGRAGPVVRLPSELRGSLRGTTLQRQCRVLTAPTPCRPAARRYRTADGSCNNLQRPRLGAAISPLQRFLSPRYVDGVQSVRTNLPSARLVSTRIHRPHHIESPSITLMLMQWGQLIDHDITSTPGSRAFNGSTPRCCGDSGRSHLPSHLLHPECLPITIPNDDPVLDRFSIRCMEFVRSAPVPREDCDFGHRQQMNQVTSYIDASTIYGSSASQADGIRLFRGGMIRFGSPDPPNGGEPCRLGAVSAQCLRPGDGRASEQPALTALHITWVRRHNQIATVFSSLNPHWSDEKIYQEARRLVAACLQHITYREFLPIILGHEVVRLFDLELVHKGFYMGYDQKVNPAPSNSFSAAAYRFGHSLVQNSFIRSDKFHRPIFNNVSLHDEQANVENIWSPGSVDRLMLGLVNQPSQKRDEFISVELTNHLFQSPGSGSNSFGLDLAAINIQRGRDHGLPSYTSWREPCGLSPVRNWTDLQRVMSVESAERFRSIYLNVDDIDLYSAGLAERPVRGGLVGPTFACIIAQQFSNLRKGDRFWYENENFESSFTSTQLQQVRKITFAQIICETMPEIETVQPFVFLSPDNFENRRELCTDLVDFDFTPWTESQNEDQSNIFTRPINSIFENGVENRAELNQSSLNNKRKNPKLQQEEDLFSFSLSSLKLKTNQNVQKEDVLKQTILRRDIRQAKYLMNKESPNNTNSEQFNKVEHREIDDIDNGTLQINNTDALTETNCTDKNINDGVRNERKRKRKPTVQKSTQKPPFATTIVHGIKIMTKNKTKSDLKQMYYGPEYPEQYYPSNYPSTNEEILIGTKRPSNNHMTYLLNTVRKTSTSTTPKPDYQFHIQINYFYNSTTETYQRPTQPSNAKRPTYNYDRPTQYEYNKHTQNYNYNRPYSNNKPNSYSVHESDYPSLLYSGPGQNFHNTFSNDKIDFGHNNNRYTTAKPSLVTSNPITVIEINPQKPDTINRPNIYIVNDHSDNKPLKPTYDYNRFPPHTLTYNTKPETLIYKRPITGHITKLDTKPIVINEQPDINDNKHYGTEILYDNEYLANKRRPTLYHRPDSTYNVHDKLNFNEKQFVKISSIKKHIFTTPNPIDDDRHYVRISTVKGHTTKTDSLNPIYISVQNKESDDDLEMTYDDILEVYVKPDDGSFTYDKNSDMTRTEKPETEQKITNDDTCSNELPRPLNLFIEDDLLEF